MLDNHLPYEVQTGDTLWDIAKNQLGDGTHWTEIRQANGLAFSEEEASGLQIGEIIYLPSEGTNSASETTVPNDLPVNQSESEKPPSTEPNPDFYTYTVASKDTLWDIAQQELGDGNRWTEILRQDGTTFTEATAATLQVGQEIYIPGTTRDNGPVSQPTPSNPSEPPTSGEIEYGTYEPDVEQAFLDKVANIANQLEAAPEYLMAVMGFETGGSYAPDVRNPESSATGLIQFVESTAKSLGTSTAQLADMTALDQLDFVEQYLQPYSGRFSTLEDVYMAVLWPAAVGQEPDAAIFTQGDKFYTANSGLDINQDGSVTTREAADKVRNYLPSANLFEVGDLDPNLPTPPPTEPAPSPEDRYEYTIQSGDTLSAIAERELGDANRWRDIQKEDGSTFTEEEATNLNIDQIVYIPGTDTPPVDDTPRPETPTTGSITNNIVEIARQELTFFQDGALKENESGAIERVNEYWQNVGRDDLDGTDRDWPWSAAFISWVMKEAGASDRFEYSASHSTYIADAVASRKNGDSDAAFIAYRLDEYSPQVGDLVGFSRQAGITFDSQPPYKSHTDIVVAVRDGEIDVIGGNTSDSVTLRTFQTDAQGRLIDPSRDWFVVLSNQLDTEGTAQNPPLPSNTPTVPSTNPNDGVLQVGDSGPQVQALQEQLLELGYELPQFGADGDFGNETKSALQTFQLDHGLESAGVLDDITAGALEWKHVNEYESALGTLANGISVKGSIGAEDDYNPAISKPEKDESDTFNFSIDSDQAVKLHLGGLSNNAGLTLLDSNNEFVAATDGLVSNTIVEELEAGDYLIRINNLGETDYRLNVSEVLDGVTSPAPSAPPTSQPPTTPPTNNTVVDLDLEFETSGRSMWSSGKSIDLDESDFKVPEFLGHSWDESGSFEKLGVGLEGFSKGKVGLQPNLALSSGSVNASLPVDFQFSVPDKISPGQEITIASSYSIDEGAFFETLSPRAKASLDLIFELNAGIKASIPGKDFDLFEDVDASAKINLLDLGKEEQSDEEEPNQTESDEEKPDQGIFGKSTDLIKKFGSLDLNLPEIDTRGTFDGNSALSNGDDSLITAKLDLDGIASTFIPQLPPLEAEFEKFGVEGAYNLLDVEVVAELLAKQDFSISLDNIPGQLTLENGDLIDFVAGEDITYTLPDNYDFGEALDIEANFNVDTNFKNTTGLSYAAGVDLAALSASGKADIPVLPDVDFSLGPVLSEEFRPFGGDLINLYQQEFALGGWNSESEVFQIAVV